MANQAVSLSALADSIATQARAIEDALKKNGVPLPSFGTDTPDEFALDPQLQFARMQLLDAVQDLHILLQNPTEYLMNETLIVCIIPCDIDHSSIDSLITLQGKIRPHCDRRPQSIQFLGCSSAQWLSHLRRNRFHNQA
jgi:hypothetical protein